MRFLIVFLFVLLVGCGGNDLSPEQKARREMLKQRAEAKAAQNAAQATARGNRQEQENDERRWRLIEKLVDQERVFYKVENVGGTPHVWVAPRFYSLAFDQKQKILGVVAAYYYDAQSDGLKMVTVKDSQSGRRIGSFDSLNGLQLD